MRTTIRVGLLALTIGKGACGTECNFETLLEVDVRTSLAVGEEFVPQNAAFSGCDERSVSPSDLRWSSEDESIVAIRADSLGYIGVSAGTASVRVRFVGDGPGNGDEVGWSVSVTGSPSN